MRIFQPKRISVFALLFFIFTIAGHAQQEIFELDVDRIFQLGNTKVYYFPGRELAEYAVVLDGRATVETILFNRSKVKARFLVDKNPFEEFTGGYVQNDTIAVFMERELEKLNAYSYCMSTNELNKFSISFTARGEKELNVISSGTRYIRITVKKDAPVICVYDFACNGKFIRTEYDVSEKALKSGISDKQLWKDYLRSDFVGFDGREILLPEQIAKNSKIYSRNDSLFFLLNDDKRDLKVITLNLRNNQPSFLNIQMPLKDTSGNIAFNTCLFEDKLYSVLANENELLLSINELTSGRQIADFRSDKDDTLWFKNTPVAQDGTWFEEGITKQYNSTRQFIKKMQTDHPLIYAAHAADGHIELTIGAIKELKIRRFQNNTNSVSSVYNNMPMPPNRRKRTNGRSNDWQRLTRFKTYLNKSASERLPRESVYDVMARAYNYELNSKIDAAEGVFIDFNGTILFAYYDAQTGKLHGVKFKR